MRDISEEVFNPRIVLNRFSHLQENYSFYPILEDNQISCKMKLRL